MKNNDWNEELKKVTPKINGIFGHSHFVAIQSLFSRTLEEAVKAEGERIAVAIENIPKPKYPNDYPTAPNKRIADLQKGAATGFITGIEEAAKIARSHGEKI